MKSELKDHVLTLTFNDEKTNNAFGLSSAKELQKNLKTKNVKLIVLRAEGRVFCSGGQLHEYAQLKNKAAGIKINREIRKILGDFAKLPIPKIAVVTGDCFGGGIELISCCNFILSEPHVFYGMWQRKMALSFGWGGYGRLRTRISESRLQTWLLLTQVLPASRVQQMGLCRVIPAGQMEAELNRLQRHLLSFDERSFAQIQKSLSQDEEKLFENLWWSSEHQQILKNFVGSKKTPRDKRGSAQ